MKLKLKQKMFFGSAFLAVVSVVVTAYFTGDIASNLGQQALTDAAQEKISSIRDTKKSQVEEYFNLVINQIQSYAGSRTTIDAMRGFKEAFPRFQYEAGLQADEGPPIPQTLPINEYRDAVKRYYENDFAQEYGTLNVNETPKMEEMIQQLNDNSIALQYFYIANNPNPLGTKEELFAAKDGSTYTQLHQLYHPGIREYMNRFIFDDIFLVDSDTGNVVYSVVKGIDFSTSLLDGPFAKTGIANVFEQANRATTPDQFAIIDFAQYLPSYDAQAAFIAAPIFDGNLKIGVLIFQLPIDSINNIMTYDRAWRLDESGRSGETFIVSADGTMRNDSRALVEDKEGYLQSVEQYGTSPEAINNIELKDTSVGLQKVDNPGTRAAFSGVTGFDMFDDYKGDFVLSAYAPINVPGLQWAIFSNLTETESLERLIALRDEILTGSIPIAVIALVFGGLAGFLIFGRIAKPIGVLEQTVSKVAEGDFTARADIRTGDELETLANAFNGLLDDRLSALAKAEKENEMLNNSIIELLKASFQLSQRDLTVQVPVTEDVTGPLADAINQMATETSKVLLNVRRITDEVETASQQVRVQASNVSKVAEAERAVVDTTMAELAAAAEAMNKIAEVAQSCNEIATQATRSTQTALATVTSTVDGMAEIRETIHETEKRIKRLGERSQEISSIVDIINNIAERTHVLALNASMQAAAAGEAGRGFSVVADEVQRLAESSRNATSQISALVKNIQLETNDTIATMDKTIQQVIEGSRLAERSGEQMKETQNTISNLVQVVEQIAMASRQQAQISNELRERAQTIQMSTQETGKQLEEQLIQTDRLVDFSKQLIESIRVFKLPTS
ncbi:methyl-accepting chemotaxis protein [Beggiatoa leptomitoformis]|uniref:HAMP domain-containing protein n=1 Tax=Beggiatoa leptomitoformis TaxID=288004 RepID=A0A2N9YGX5_9GAMM|nr:methyl-accepting chemotaxis protein [Beggiatoa leptomitoformis]AUI69723.1 HAMP domain-containing protein [Beggiatoa leptomitoformis]QGX03689.1 HAMP domain-containing protein [Beggiatoa leptomitoformis]